MSEISVLEGRLQAALERIGRVLEEAPAPAPQSAAPSEELQEELRSKLSRIAELESQLAEKGTEHQLQVEELSSRLEAAEERSHNLQSAIAALRGRIEGLRNANKSRLADADLVNSSLEVELKAMTALRESEQAELAAVLADLTPLVKGSDDA